MSGRERATTVAAAAALALVACVAKPLPPDVPALLTSPTAEGRAELVQAVSRRAISENAPVSSGVVFVTSAKSEMMRKRCPAVVGLY